MSEAIPRPHSIWWACVARNGEIAIGELCVPGTVPVCADTSRRRLEAAVCRASRRVRGHAVVIPGLTLAIADEHAEVLVREFAEAVREQRQQLRDQQRRAA